MQEYRVLVHMNEEPCLYFITAVNEETARLIAYLLSRRLPLSYIGENVYKKAQEWTEMAV